MNVFDLKRPLPGDDFRDLRDCLRAAQAPLCRACQHHYVGRDGSSLCRARNCGVEGSAPKCVVAEERP